MSSSISYNFYGSRVELGLLPSSDRSFNGLKVAFGVKHGGGKLSLSASEASGKLLGSTRLRCSVIEATIAEDEAKPEAVEEEVLSAEEKPHSGNGVAAVSDKESLNNKRFASVATSVVHAGERPGRPQVHDSLTTPIVQTATYFFKDTDELIAFQEGRYVSFEYGRYGNPTTQTVEKKISEIEGAEATLLSSSGMCAATTMLLALVPQNGHIVTTTDCYRRTRQFIQTMLPKMGIQTTVIDPSDMSSLQAALEKNQVSLFFSESPTNPYLRCIDIELVSKMCHDNGALVCIDCTFATPVNQKAIAFGADLVLHSATKYYSGHNDVLAGCLSGKSELIGKVKDLHNVLGGVVDPHAAYLLLRGMKTLDLRVQRQNESALKLATALEAHPKVSTVHYPGLKSHPEHEIAKKQMSGFGGVISFEIDGDLKTTSNFIDALKIPYIAPSLGGCESLVEQPTIISYWDYSPEERAEYGIKDNLVRFSCGIENYEDIYNDMMQALDSI